MAAAALGACSGSTTASLSAAAVSQPGDGSVATAQSGSELNHDGAMALEGRLATTPTDLQARERLVGYYYQAELLAPARDPQALVTHAPTIARDGHLVWLIQHDPGLELLHTSPLGVVQPAPDSAGYSVAETAWAQQAALPSATAEAKGNAGVFFAAARDPRAEALLKSAESGDSADPTWPSALADLYLGQVRAAPTASTSQRQAAGDALAQLESAWKLSGQSDEDVRLDELAKLAVVAGDDAKAAGYAARLLRAYPADPQQSPLTYGHEQYDGDMVQGLVALHRGDVATAELLLLRAGATQPSPQMSVSGPNFSLARELLIAREQDVVLKYFALVGKYWSDPRLATWRTSVQAGSVPDFGDNLWT